MWFVVWLACTVICGAHDPFMDHDHGAHAAAVQTLEYDDGVAILTGENFDPVLEQRRGVLVEFYAPWCGHCRRFAPEYVGVAAQLKQKFERIEVGKVDATQEITLAKKYNVKAYPTFVMFKAGHKISEYDGARTAEAIMQYFSEIVAPVILTGETEAQVRKYIPTNESGKLLVVAYGGLDAPMHHLLTAFGANWEGNEYELMYVTDKEVTRALRERTNTLMLYKGYDERKILYQGDQNVTRFTRFLRLHSFPMVGQIHPDNHEPYLRRGYPLLCLFLEPGTELSKRALSSFEKVARNFKGRISFVWLDGVKWVEIAHKFTLSGTVFPSIALDTVGSEEHFVYEEGAEITAIGVQTFLEKYFRDELTPRLWSAPVPEEPYDEHNVRQLVASNFLDFVTDKRYDVFVILYAADGCPPCLEFLHVVRELATQLQSITTLRFAGFDITQNDTPRGYRGPTLPQMKLVKADTNEVKNFRGIPVREDLVAYLQRTVTHPFLDPEWL